MHRILAARAADVDRRVLEAFAQTLRPAAMGTGTGSDWRWADTDAKSCFHRLTSICLTADPDRMR